MRKLLLNDREEDLLVQVLSMGQNATAPLTGKLNWNGVQMRDWRELQSRILRRNMRFPDTDDIG